jgi:hypothetical protein
MEKVKKLLALWTDDMQGKNMTTSSALIQKALSLY